MQATTVTNPDCRPLPAGWVVHFDSTRNLWYYINLDETPLQASFIHPDDQDLPSQHPRKRSATVPTGFLSHRQMASTRTSTPISSAVQAVPEKKPTFAQQLYASAMPPSRPMQLNSNEEEDEENSTIFDRIPRSTSPQKDTSTSTSYPTHLLSPISVSTSSPSSSPPAFYFPLSFPEWTPPQIFPGPPRRPRGARRPTFPRPIRPSANLSLALTSVSASTDDLRDRVLSNPIIPTSAPASSERMAHRETTSRHLRSATVPNMTDNSAYAPPQNHTSKHETPAYALISRPLAVLPHSKNLTFTKPAFQALPTLESLPSPTLSYLSPILSPISPTVLPIIGLPFSTHIPPTSDSSSIATLPGAAPRNNLANPPAPSTLPTQYFFPSSQSDIDNRLSATVAGNVANRADDHQAEVLKRVGMAVGKSAGQTASSSWQEDDVGEYGCSNKSISSSENGGDGDIIRTVTAGVSELAVSAASTASNAALNTSSISLKASPGILYVNSKANSITPANYGAVLIQTQAMQLAQ